MNIKPFQFDVGDFIETPGHTHTRLYHVQGVHLGGLGQEDVIELSAIDRSKPTGYARNQVMFVPKEMIEAGLTAGIFTQTKEDLQ